MAFIIGGLIGGLFLMIILMSIWRWVLSRWLSGLLLPVVATISAFSTATLIGGFGMADGGPPQFWLAFTKYLIPALVVGAVGVAIFFIKSRQN